MDDWGDVALPEQVGARLPSPNTSRAPITLLRLHTVSGTAIHAPLGGLPVDINTNDTHHKSGRATELRPT